MAVCDKTQISGEMEIPKTMSEGAYSASLASTEAVDVTAFGSRRLAKLIAGQKKRGVDATVLDKSLVDGTPLTSTASEASIGSMDEATAFGSKRLGKLLIGYKPRGGESFTSQSERSDGVPAAAEAMMSSTSSTGEPMEVRVLGSRRMGKLLRGQKHGRGVAANPASERTGDNCPMGGSTDGGEPVAESEEEAEKESREDSAHAEAAAAKGAEPPAASEVPPEEAGEDPEACEDAEGGQPVAEPATTKVVSGTFEVSDSKQEKKCSWGGNGAHGNARSIQPMASQLMWGSAVWNGACSVLIVAALSRGAPRAALVTVPMWFLGAVLLRHRRSA